MRELATTPDEETDQRDPAEHQPPEPLITGTTGKKIPAPPVNPVTKPVIVDKEPKAPPTDVNDPTAAPVDLNQLKNERIARFIQTVANTSKQDLQFIINDTAPDTKAKTIKLFLKLIGVPAADVSALLTSAEQQPKVK